MKRWLFSALLLVLMTTCRPASAPPSSPLAVEGVSLALARHRTGTLSDLRYDVHLSIPEHRDEAIRGQVTVRFAWRGEPGPLVLDFAAPPENIVAVRAEEPGGEPRSVRHSAPSTHLVIAEDAIRSGENAVTIDFVAGDGSLNRQDDFLYTLFVPDRAHHALPCFDQPDLKARFRLTLETPESWEAVANGELTERRAHDETAGRTVWRFAETGPISTYLFAFAAGRFRVETAERDGRTLRFLHRETDRDKLERNRGAIFDLHGQSLAWLEDYTAIPYPFGKLDFVLIPGFQYGGMEHPGAVFYRDSRLLLDEPATQDELLGRASLIAHETAHMWFGDLVTMTWFDDVWLKEVFANFMAAKIVEPAFPELPHAARFFLAHFPAAYEIDRSAGTHPIRQELDNLREAGSLYGAIIYQKAPIVMRHLERQLGEATLQDGLRAYLDRYRFANASWLDLIAILDERTPADLAAWSTAWVEEAGRPLISSELELAERRVASLRLRQSDPSGSGRRWPQQLSLLLGDEAGARFEVDLSEPVVELPAARDVEAPRFILPGADGLGYGHLRLDEASRAALLADLARLPSAATRAVAWLALWDEMLAGRVDPVALFELALRQLEAESETLVVERLLRDLESLFWRVLSDAERQDLAVRLESTLWRQLETATAEIRKPSLLQTYIAVVITPDGVAKLRRLWRGELELADVPLSEQHLTTLAFELAVRGVEDAEAILDEQLSRIEQSDRRARFAFIRPALSADPQERAGFFAGLAEPRRRAREPWVQDALGYLHHPLRAEASAGFILPSLELLEEIQRTGDIFFPKRWLDATLSGHRSPEAARTVKDFLAARPDYPPRLRAKILQAADLLLRNVEQIRRAG